MDLKRQIMRIYFLIYRFISAERVLRRDLDEKWIHAHLVSVLTSSLLMWAYAFLAYFTIQDPLPARVGFFASGLHLLSPLIFRFSRSRYLATNVFLLAGITHQATFSYFTGGFESPFLVWLGILPVMAGGCSGPRGILVWAVTTVSVVSAFLIGNLLGLQYPDLITKTGFIIAQFLLCFGWIFLASSVIFIYVALTLRQQQELERKNINIQNLVNVLSHDITNSMSFIQWILGHVLENPSLDEQNLSYLKKGQKHSENIMSIITSVREFHASELGKKEIPLMDVELSQVGQNLADFYSTALQAKNLQFELDSSLQKFKVRTNEAILEHQILGNLLSNAIKFSERGQKILFKAHKEDGMIVLVLQDFGVGIPPTLVHSVFDIKLRSNRPGTGGELGTGFGLPIAKAFSEKLGGELNFVSNADPQLGPTGTTFFLKLRAR